MGFKPVASDAWKRHSYEINEMGRIRNLRPGQERHNRMRLLANLIEDSLPAARRELRRRRQRSSEGAQAATEGLIRELTKIRAELADELADHR